jgi:hypothetical protein
MFGYPLCIYGLWCLPYFTGGQKQLNTYLVHNLNVNQDRYITVQVIDYLYNSYKNKQIKEYIGKRWNMYNIMGSTIFGIILGVVFGCLLRNHIEYYSTTLLIVHEKVVALIGIVLILAFFSGMHITRKEHEYMLWNLLYDAITNNEVDWKKSFPNEYFYQRKATT